MTTEKIPGLVYFPDTRPGIARVRRGRGFSYIDANGKRIEDIGERDRIKALAVPPAYEKVWICPVPNGHLQATGLDARQRKQFRYHPDWTTYRAQKKYDSLATFGSALPAIRRAVSRDLKGDAGDVGFATAAVVAMLDKLALRIGSPSSAEENGSFGATTLKLRHLQLKADGARLRFTAKGGKKVVARLDDARLNKVLHKMDDLPGVELFRWLDEAGEVHPVTSGQVNAYLAGIAGSAVVTAKGFRTWNGTLAAFDVARREEGDLTISALAEAAAERLHNTATIARNSYIHPDVIDLTEVDAKARQKIWARLTPKKQSGLRVRESELIAFLSRK